MMTFYVSPYRKFARRDRRVDSKLRPSNVSARDKVLAVDVKSDNEAYTISALIPGILSQ